MKGLIYFDKNILEPTGGPTGYLYNLYNELLKENIQEIDFLDSYKGNLKSKNKKIFYHLPKSFQTIYRKLKKYLKRYKILEDIFENKNKKANIDIDKYDFIHFHSTVDMYMVKDSLKDYKGKVILTSHSPKAQFKEIIEDRTELKYYLKRKNDFDKLEEVDKYAFNRADIIIFPCEDAEEPYYNTWEDYKKIKEINKYKYMYLPTGILPIDIEDNTDEIRERYNIPKDAFVISYVGRHNEVKGYDSLKKIGKKILEKNENIYFLIGGNEHPITRLENKHWIEVGWTNKAHQLIQASDVFILPNKETYFDLILLEVLSIGKPVILTNTGGNKYFKKFDKAGLYYYDYNNTDQVIEIIKEIQKEDLKKLGNINKKIMNENFTTEIFVKNYLKIINEIIKK